jgi:7-cyano-7-deazaguanine synthase in queuosine biosynthesis
LSTPKGEPVLSWDNIKEVVLFSGGLDSLGGVADRFLREEQNIIAVSHRSADKTYSTQRRLLNAVRALAPHRLLPHVAIRIHRHENRLRTERTQRSRSFLYAAIAGTVARLIGLRRILFYENGPIALNLPISRQLVGAKGTRTAHPKVLRGFADIISRVAGETFEVHNPFQMKTRAEVIEHIDGCGAGDLMRKTVSCAYTTKKGRSQIQYPHCGVYSQCVDRQFSFRAAGLQHLDSDEGYEVHLVNDEWTSEDARVMLLDYVDAAERFSRCKNREEFLSLFGETTRAMQGLYEGVSQGIEQIAQAIFELHKRHGEGVMRVVSELFA